MPHGAAAAQVPQGYLAAPPEVESSVAVALRAARAARAPPPSSAPPPLSSGAVRCGGRPSQAPFAPSTVRVGEMLGVGDPCPVSWRDAVGRGREERGVEKRGGRGWEEGRGGTGAKGVRGEEGRRG